MNLEQRIQLYAVLRDNSLKRFVQFAWPIIEPTTPFMDNWHIDAICDHLEAVTRGDIRRLIINIPPRHAKSTLISVLWPAWVWTFHSSSKWLYASYGASLSVRDTIRFKDVISSMWYQSLFGDRFKLTKTLEDNVRNNKEGFRLASSVSGGSTGEGGDFIVADDPHKIEEAENEVARQNVIDWWTQTINTRLNNPKTSRQVVVMQRVHEGDLSGYLLESNTGYTHLKLPMKYEPTTYVTKIGWKDPRTVEGELLWPERFGPEEVDQLEKDLLEYGFASKYQQSPAPKGGAMFQRQWMQLESMYPVEVKRVIRYWDKAGTAGGGAYTVGVRISLTLDNLVYVEDVVRAQLDDLDREKLIRFTADLDSAQRPQTEIWIEMEGGSGGKDSAAATIRNLAGYKVFAERPTGDKVARASPLAAYMKAGNVRIIKAPWNQAYIGEFEMFPRGKYKDQVDATAAGFNRLFRGGTAWNVGGKK